MSERRQTATIAPPEAQTFPELVDAAVSAERQLRAAQKNSKRPIEDRANSNSPEIQAFDTELASRIGDIGLYAAFIREVPDAQEERAQLDAALEDLKETIGVSGLAVRAVARATKRIAGQIDPTNEVQRDEFQQAATAVLDALGYVDESKQDKNRPSKEERRRHAARPKLFDDDERQGLVTNFEQHEADLSADIEEIAELFTTIYKPARDRLQQAEVFKNAFPLTDHENAVVLSEIKATNRYARLLTDVFLGLNSDDDRRNLDKALLDILVSDAKADQAIGKPADVEGIKRTYNQMMTGIKLDAASMRALQRFSDEFGWDVRSSSVEEDVEKGVDAYSVRRADGVEVPIDFKSDRSFEKQAIREKEGDLPGIKLKHNKQTGRVLVVNSQRLGNADRVTGAAKPIRGWKLADERGFATAVHQAIERW